MAGVLLDTGFVIALSKPDDRHYSIARQYWRHFLQHHIPMYLSAIVVAEFSLVMEIPDDILKCCIILPFGYKDAVKAGKFDLLRGREQNEKRDALKDDMKIIAHAANASVDYVITRDANSFVRYCKTMTEQAKIRFRVIELSDGFKESNFNQGQQDLLTNQGF